jgi:hypothetical protein
MVHWWSNTRIGILILFIGFVDSDHELTPKHLCKCLSALLNAPHFYLTIMGSVVVSPIKLIGQQPFSPLWSIGGPVSLSSRRETWQLSMYGKVPMASSCIEREDAGKAVLIEMMLDMFNTAVLRPVRTRL